MNNYQYVFNFLKKMHTQEEIGYRSTPNGPVTLYATCYAILTQYYLGVEDVINTETKEFISGCQAETGEFIGPELHDFEARKGIMHDRKHLLHHLTCAVIPVCLQFDIFIRHPLTFAYQYCDIDFLNDWLNACNFTHAWFEGNNIFFVGQLLVYLRDIENHPQASEALECWFEWLDGKMDPRTNLWGTNGFCSPAEAVYGGYHQLLVYFYENREITNPQGLIDTVLSLQHSDGGFNPKGNAGACEDVDSVDILVNCYKRYDYRRPEIRHALRRCLKHILSTQNSDGGFPYNRNQPQSHMGIPGTEAAPNVSCTFPTWFRVHTLALIAEVIPNEPTLKGIPFRFNSSLSMGWHESPSGWIPVSDAITFEEKLLVLRHNIQKPLFWLQNFACKAKRYIRN